jgi:Mce-associated membrane protein
VPSFRRRASVIDADSVGQSPHEPDRAADAAQALALAEEAEAEAAEAEAAATAARARARAIRLRRQAGAIDSAESNGVTVDAEAETEEAEASDVETPEATDVETPEATDTEIETESEPDTAADEAGIVEKVVDKDDDEANTEADDEADDVDTAEEKPARSRSLRLPLPSWKQVAAGFVVLCTCALLAASGYMVWQHRQAVQEQQRAAEYAAAGRQSVVTLMSLDFNKAQEDVDRIINNSTGSFRDDFKNQAADFVKVAQESKVITEVTVNAVGVQAMTKDSASVLVSATSRVTNAAGAKQEPRTWRLAVSLQRDGGQIKMSKVEFVP